MKIVNKVSLDRQHKYAIKVGLSVFILLLVVGITYAAFNYAGIGNLVNSISTETVTMTYTEGTNKISLENALPTEDETGMKLTTGDNVFDFTVYIKATNKQAIAYEVTAEKDETSTLGDNDVRIYLEKSLDKTNYEKVSDPSGYVPILENDKFGAKTGEMVLDAGTTSREQTYYYRLRMWVSKDYNVASESKFFTITVNVYGVGSNEIDAERIILSDTNVTMKQNESKQLSYTIKPDNASDKRVTWKSSNEKVAVVDSDGNVTGVGEGTAVITATAKDGEKASCNFTITKPDPADISVTATELDLKTNKKIALNAKVEPSNANTTKLTYESSNPDIVSVDEEGNLKTGTKAGTATITIKTETGITKKVTVTVTNQQAEGVTIDKTELEMITGSSEQLTATITPDDTIDKTITWTSSNNDAATVDNTGKVKAVGPGTATITATAVGGAKAESTIKVQNPLPSSVTASEETVDMKSGTTHQLSATVKPDNARSKVLTYTSSNPAVATVSDTGLVTAQGAGTSTITLKTINGLTDTVIINVTNVKYTVNHNKMNIDGNGYTKADTETFSGKVGDKVTPSVKEYTGFNSPSAQTITLTEDDATINYNYDRKKYTLTLTDVKGADTNGSTATGEYYYETPITLKAIAKTGYTWSKWSDGETEKTRSFKLTKDISVSPVVTTNTYTIDYDLAGGEVANKNPDTYTVETERFTLNNPTKKGYTFAGWSGSNGTTPSTTVTVETGTTGKLSYTANWSKDTYTITYNLFDGKVSTANPSTYTVTDDAITLNNPSKTGYTFIGWTGSNGETPNKSVIIKKGSAGKLTYNANWKINSYTATFDGNGGTNGTSITKNYGETLGTLPTTTRKGYTFNGWLTAKSGGTKISSDTTMPASNPTYYAQWSIITYNITYNLNGGTASNPKTYNVDTADITLNNPVKTGYTFTGWTGSNGTTKQTSVKIVKGSTEDKTYTANFSPITYKITFNKNDTKATGTMSDETFTYDTARTLTSNAFAKKGYNFASWNTKADGTGTSYANGSSIKNLTSTNGETITLYARWTRDEYTINYNLNGGSLSGQKTSYNVDDAAFTLPTPAKTGYTFAGWTGSNGTTAQTTVTVPTGTTGKLTYNATWTKNSYYLDLNFNLDNKGQAIDGTSTAGGPYTAKVTIDGVATTVSGDYYQKVPYGSTYKVEITPNAGYSATTTTWSDTMPAKAVSISIPLSTLSYSISYNLNGGANNSSNPSSYNVRTADITLAAPTRNGYTFAGWTGSNGSAKQTSVKIAKGTTGAKNYTANWTPTSYKINYSLNGGTNNSSNPTNYTIESNDITLSTPTRNGYDFSGWGTTNLTTGLTSYTTSNPYSAGARDNILGNEFTVTSGKKYRVLVTAKRTKGSLPMQGGIWYTAQTSGNSYDNYSGEFKQIETLSNGFARYYKDVTIPTGKTKGKFYIQMDQQSDNLTTAWSLADMYVEDLSALSTSVKITKGSTGDKTYNANWTPKTYSITYNCNGGSGCTNGHYNIENDDITLPTPTRQGYTFTGWTGSNGTTPETTVKILKGSTGDRTYTANWSINSYTATFNGNGGSNGTSITKPYGAQLGTLPTSARSGYQFLGWFTGKTDGTQVSNRTTMPLNGATYYAHWKESSASETISGKTGTVADDSGNVRYTGANPNNYVRFNNELWRIVGSFANISNGTTSSKRIKLVKNGYAYTGTAFDSNDSNDYSTSTLKTTLNGTYYNNLSTDAKNMIDNAIWNIGGFAPTWNVSTGSNAADFYAAERSSTVYSGHATTWTGKIGLMYPSDYLYATSGSSSVSRTTCLSTSAYSSNSNWFNSSGGGPCAQNDYLFDSSHWQWTMTPYSGYSYDVFSVYYYGSVTGSSADATNSYRGVRPAVFLKSSISISGGSGTASDPYTLTG